METTKPLHILLISSNQYAKQFWQSQLTSPEDRVLNHWQNPKDALDNVHSLQPDLIIIDDYFTQPKPGQTTGHDAYAQLLTRGYKRPTFYISPKFSELEHWLIKTGETPYYRSGMSLGLIECIEQHMSMLHSSSCAPEHKNVA